MNFNVSNFKEESLSTGMTRENSPIGPNLPDAVQSISSPSPTDYFRRIGAGSLERNEVPDQVIISEILRYEEDREGDLPDQIAANTTWAAKVVQFEGMIPTAKLTELIEDHLGALGRKMGGQAREESPGFRELRDLHNKRRGYHDKDPEWLSALLQIALEHSLELAHGVYTGYVDRFSPEFAELLPARNSWVGGIRSRLSSQGSTYLSRAVARDFPYALYHTMRYQDKYPSFGSAEEWRWLVPHILEAMAEHPEQIVPDVAVLVIRDMRGPRGGEGVWFDFDQAYFEDLCVESCERTILAKGLLSYAEQQPASDSTSQKIRYVSEYLERYCAPDCSEGEIAGNSEEENDRGTK